jgi:hypothetical protein
VSEQNPDIEPEAEPGVADATEDVGLELKRPDPRLRPPDPVGTQPLWDPEDLLPRETPRARAGRLWSTPGEDEDESPADVRERLALAARTGAPLPVGAGGGGDGANAADGSGSDSGDDAPRYSRYSARFQFFLGALLAIGVAAIALLVAVLAGGKDDTTVIVKAGPAWSEWRPTASTGAAAAEQIADHVGVHYKLPNGKQLVGVRGGALEIQQVPVTIAIQEPASKGGSVDYLSDGSGVMYRMDGIGTSDGHIPGTPSPNRHLLLRREALELALYSFRYLGVSETVVLFPPTVDTNRDKTTGTLSQSSTPKSEDTAFLFRRDQADVQAALAHPLKTTLSAETPSVNGISRSPDAATVRSLTNTKAYTYNLQQANTDLRLFLVLAPISLR